MADKQITPFQLTDQFTMDNFNQRINETNIALQSKPNPNLLDNWYFGNPVDQRGGYVVPPGVMTYSDQEMTVSTGPTSRYFAVKQKTDSYAYFEGGAGNKYYFDPSNAVRGYTGAGYGIDRWILGDIWTVGKAALSVNDGYITLQEGLFQRKELKRSKMNGRVLSVSALFADGTLGHGVIHLPDEIVIGTTYTDGVSSTYGCVRYISEDILEYRTEANGSQYVAAKLELGSQQTLAHKDENGVWQLNETPDYGEQLVRCQRYYRQFNDYTKFIAQYIDGTKVVFVLPVSMRTAPVMSGNWNIYTGFTAQTGFTLNTYQTGNIIVIEAVKENHGLTSAWLGVSGIGVLKADL